MGRERERRLDQSELLGGRLDVMKILAAVPMQEVRRMQAALAANAHKLVYGLARGVPATGRDVAEADCREVTWVVAAF